MEHGTDKIAIVTGASRGSVCIVHALKWSISP